MTAKYALLLAIASSAAFVLASCGSKSDDQQIVGVPYNPSTTSTATTTGNSSSAELDDDVGPQYTQPSMDTLRGVRQKFPAHYTLKRYPRARMVIAWVSPHLQPGWKNQVMLKSDDPPQLIATYYKRDLSKEGWKMISQYENPAYSSTIWRKDGQEAEVRVSPDQYNKENIQLFVGPLPLPSKDVAQTPR